MPLADLTQALGSARANLVPVAGIADAGDELVADGVGVILKSNFGKQLGVEHPPEAVVGRAVRDHHAVKTILGPAFQIAQVFALGDNAAFGIIKHWLWRESVLWVEVSSHESSTPHVVHVPLTDEDFDGSADSNRDCIPDYVLLFASAQSALERVMQQTRTELSSPPRSPVEFIEMPAIHGDTEVRPNETTEDHYEKPSHTHRRNLSMPTSIRRFSLSGAGWLCSGLMWTV